MRVRSLQSLPSGRQPVSCVRSVLDGARGWLVRWLDADGVLQRQWFETRAEAERCFQEQRERARGRKGAVA